MVARCWIDGLVAFASIYPQSHDLKFREIRQYSETSQDLEVRFENAPLCPEAVLPFRTVRTQVTDTLCCTASASTTTIIMPHQALGIDEILREVAARVVDTHPPTAVSLACCAKSFEEPALRTLWETQTQLLALVKTLPPDCWDVVPPNTPGGEPEVVCGSFQLRIFN